MNLAQRTEVRFLPLHQKAFRETLTLELVETGSTTFVEPGPFLASHDKPVHIPGHSTAGCLRCRHCQTKTPVKYAISYAFGININLA